MRLCDTRAGQALGPSLECPFVCLQEKKRKLVLTPTLNEEMPPHFRKWLHPCVGPRCASFPPQHTHEKRLQPHRR